MDKFILKSKELNTKRGPTLNIRRYIYNLFFLSFAKGNSTKKKSLIMETFARLIKWLKTDNEQ